MNVRPRPTPFTYLRPEKGTIDVSKRWRITFIGFLSATMTTSETHREFLDRK